MNHLFINRKRHYEEHRYVEELMKFTEAVKSKALLTKYSYGIIVLWQVLFNRYQEAILCNAQSANRKDSLKTE